MANKPQLNKMIYSVLDKDGQGFREVFNDIAMDKIQTAVQNRTREVSQDIISSISTDDAPIKNNDESTNIIESLSEASSSGNEVKHVCNNGEVVYITENTAKNLIELHDYLNKDNQKTLRDSLTNSKREFNDMVDFAVKKLKG
tara:strand:- start:224 stop:652 length:429 start_codon:yes stop_codon:yes gene_type:complete